MEDPVAVFLASDEYKSVAPENQEVFDDVPTMVHNNNNYYYNGANNNTIFSSLAKPCEGFVCRSSGLSLHSTAVSTHSSYVDICLYIILYICNTNVAVLQQYVEKHGVMPYIITL